jgi:hypothetical protein
MSRQRQNINITSKRHLAQEEKTNDEKPVEEVKKTKSYASLKNWGHDPLKKREATKDKGEGAESGEQTEEAEGDEESISEEDGDEKTEHAGDKRKPAGGQSGANKKRELRNKKTANTGNDDEDEDGKDEDDEGDKKTGKQASGKKQAGESKSKKQSQNGKAADNGPNKGNTVSWNWGNGQPEGKVLDVKAEE